MLVRTVKLKRLVRRSRRLNANSFLSAEQELVDALAMYPEKTKRIGDVATVTKPDIFRRIYVKDPMKGLPYVSPADMDRTDYSGCRLISNSQSSRFGELRLTPGLIVITRSGMNLGWAMLIRGDQDGVIGTEDMIRVASRESEDVGYLAAFLASAPAYHSVRQDISGGSVKHIEPHDVERLVVPWPRKDLRNRIGGVYARAAELRAESTELINRATDFLFSSVGLTDLTEGGWFGDGRELGFSGNVGQRSLRAWNHSQKAERIRAELQGCGSKPLGQLVKEDTLRKGPGFKRIPVNPGNGVHLIGQRQLLRFRPRPKHIARRGIPESAFCHPGTTLIAARGTFGEAETFGRAQLVSQLTCDWLFSNDILRVVPEEAIHSGWLFAFMRSRSAFRLIRSVATGSKQQDLHPKGMAEIPVPIGGKKEISHVNDLVQKAFQLRDEAYQSESQALDRMVRVITEASHG